MAYVVKDARKRSPFWYAIYRDATGRRVRKSTELTSKAKALEMARALQKASDEARRGVLTEARTRELLSEVLQSINGGGLPTFTVRQWFEHFCKIKADAKDPDTAAKYAQIKREFLAFLGEPKADRNIAAINSAEVRAFRDHRKKSGVTATTLNDGLTILSAYFNAALRDHVIPNNPCTAVEPAKDDLSPAKRQKQPFTVAQIVALLNTANDDWSGLIKTAFYTGARLENCANLRSSNLDFSADPALVVFEKYSKHGDEHRVPMHPALRDHLLSIKKKHGQIRKTGKIIALPAAKKDGDPFLFPSLAGKRVANLSKQFRKLMAAADIVNRKVREGVRGKGRSAARDVWALGFHSFRRTHVSALANAGVSEERRMAITAHATRDVHKGYTHHELAQIGHAVALLPRI